MFKAIFQAFLGKIAKNGLARRFYHQKNMKNHWKKISKNIPICSIQTMGMQVEAVAGSEFCLIHA